MTLALCAVVWAPSPDLSQFTVNKPAGKTRVKENEARNRPWLRKRKEGS